MLREHSTSSSRSCTAIDPQATSCPVTQTSEHPSASTFALSETLILDNFREQLLTTHPLLEEVSTESMENSQPTHSKCFSPQEPLSQLRNVRSSPAAPTAQPTLAAPPEIGHRISSPTAPSILATTPNPFASSLSRDALLAYAYHLYSSPGQNFPGLTSIPLADALAVHTSPEQVYRLRLLPILTTLRPLHPNDLAILLLLSCTYHALGDYNACLKISQDMLRINPDYVKQGSNLLMTCVLMSSSRPKL